MAGQQHLHDHRFSTTDGVGRGMEKAGKGYFVKAKRIFYPNPSHQQQLLRRCWTNPVLMAEWRAEGYQEIHFRCWATGSGKHDGRVL